MPHQVIIRECGTLVRRLISLVIAFVFVVGVTPNAPGADPAPKKVPNPLPPATVARVQSVIVGQYAVGPGVKEREIKIVEVIRDSYRVAKIKKSLSGTLLHAERRSFIGDVYNLIFLDKDGKIVAAACYYLTAELGYVLRLSQGAFEEGGRYFDYGWRERRIPANWNPKVDYRAYAIPFGNDWQEAIGYTPGW